MSRLKSIWKALTAPSGKERRTSLELGWFTPRAQEVLELAHQEAERFRQDFVGTEHLLLGLIVHGQATAATVLRKMGVDLDAVRVAVEQQVGTAAEPHRPAKGRLTPRAKKALALAAREARAFNHAYVGTVHILLGLLREGEGIAARILRQYGVDAEETRLEILKELEPGVSATPDTAETTSKPESSEVAPDQVDIGRRYDVYCSERNEEVVVYRNALFRRRKTLLKFGASEPVSEFVELEQANGETVFVSEASIIKFCEHGVTPGAERVSGEEPRA